MKKVLLASTALVASAGWAMADVTNRGDAVGASIELRGEAWMGIVGGEDFELFDEQDDDIVINAGEPQFWTDIDLKFVMVGQTDGGLEFGAEIDIDEGPLAFDGTTEGGETLYISGAFGRLTMGDTDGALDWALTETNIGGTLADTEEHAGWNGNDGLDAFYDGQIARYEYAFGDFAIAMSGEIDDGGEGDPILGIGAKYSTNFSGIEMGFGAGVQTLAGFDDIGDQFRETLDEFFDDEDELDLDELDATVWGLSADMAFAQGIQVILNYSGQDVSGADLNGQYWGVGVGYETGPILVSANVGHFDEWTSSEGVFDAEGYGVQANYDLGGGAQLEAGYAHSTVNDEDSDVYSFGVQMNF